MIANECSFQGTYVRRAFNEILFFFESPKIIQFLMVECTNFEAFTFPMCSFLVRISKLAPLQSKITLTCRNLPTLHDSCVYSAVITAFPSSSFQPPPPPAPRPCVGPGMFIHLQRALLPKGVSVLCLVFRARGTAFLLGTFVAYPAPSRFGARFWRCITLLHPVRDFPSFSIAPERNIQPHLEPFSPFASYCYAG